jgi:hypothetical protein
MGHSSSRNHCVTLLATTAVVSFAFVAVVNIRYTCVNGPVKAEQPIREPEAHKRILARSTLHRLLWWPSKCSNTTRKLG